MRDLLAEDPHNVILFAGYPFSKDYNQARGHQHAIDDVKASGRDIDGTKGNFPGKPGTCWTCKSPDVPRLMAEMGPAKFYDTPAKDLMPEIKHNIGCADCHDPATMALAISRPALVEAFERQGKDITQVSHQEMRTLVCAQCHVEYYFKKDEAKGQKAYLTFPWDKGMGVEDMDAYYDEKQFADWTHPISGAKMVKMQHPDYEVYTKGIHAYRNVSCADCHMPYKTEGGQKFTDHQIRSPLSNISNSCAVCHRWGEDEIRGRVETIQDKILEGRIRAEEAIAKAHFDIAACKQAGAQSPVALGLCRCQQRHGLPRATGVPAHPCGRSRSWTAMPHRHCPHPRQTWCDRPRPLPGLVEQGKGPGAHQDVRQGRHATQADSRG
jgi:nitrite reductase (cytochrome c-552)